MLALLQRYLLPIVLGGGIILGVLLGGALTRFSYEGLSIPIPFTAHRLTVFEGRVGAAVAAALKGYVAEAQLAAVQAKLAELQRQKTAAEYAHAAFTKQVAADQAKDAAEAAQLQQENDAYAAALRASNRACPLDADDIQQLMR